MEQPAFTNWARIVSLRFVFTAYCLGLLGTSSFTPTPVRHGVWPTHGSLARYVKVRIAHAPGMQGTFSPPPWVSDPDMHHGTCVTHVPWCKPESLISGFLEFGGGENVPGIPGACVTRNLTYLTRVPCLNSRHVSQACWVRIVISLIAAVLWWPWPRIY